MAVIPVDEHTVKCAVYGGAILGGGGGGWIEDGLQLGRLALEVGTPKLLSADELADDDLLVTVSLVGAPAASDKFVKPVDYIKALQLLMAKLDRPVGGLITNENGAATTVNGWFQSAITGIPVIDLPCNGRAHPTGAMGSLNLTEQADYRAHQAAVGGLNQLYLETVISGNLEVAANVIRQAAVAAGGLVAVARNPVTVAYAREHGAVGAISQAIEAGEVLLSKTGEAAIEAVVSHLGGKVVTTGTVTQRTLETTGGFDIGRVMIDDVTELTIWNEYMTLEQADQRLATFPDLIMTLDAKTGMPVVSAAVEVGQQLAVIMVPKKKLRLSTTMYNPKLLKPIEQMMQKSVLAYLDDEGEEEQ